MQVTTIEKQAGETGRIGPDSIPRASQDQRRHSPAEGGTAQ